MPLSPGTRMGPYEILDALGAGGMGEVHRARDTRLRRDVAIKVLPPSFAADADRLRRFEQEAHAIGALNHPNILAVYDFGTDDGSPYLVTELLEGSTLRDEMPPPRRKALDYARQIAAGLAAAHAKGVIHRDLKPENIFITKDGRVKILDFGLAKVQLPPSQSDATRTVATTPGITMGTVGYMSPEQARGHAADARSDIFSFGSMLYEMIRGERPFARESAMDTISAILKEDPPPLADAALDRIVRRCLEKSPDQRFQSASDLGFALEALSNITAPLPVATAKPARKIPLLTTAVIAVAALALGALAVYWLQSRKPPEAAWRGDLLTGSGITYMPRISPDGKTLAFVVIEAGQAQIAVMHPGSRTWTVITSDKTHGEASAPAWSPEGTKIYFNRGNSIYSVLALGGEERLFIDQATLAEPIADGTFIIVRQNADRKSQIFRYSPETSRADPLDAETFVGAYIRAFRDGGEAVYFGRVLSDSKASMGLMAIDLKSGKSRAFSYGSPLGFVLETTAKGTVITRRRSGDLDQIAEYPRDGKSPPRAVITLTGPIWGLSAASDGAIYADQVQRPIDALQFPLTGGAPERIAETSQASFATIVPTPDGRAIYCSLLSGKPTVFITRPGKNPVPLVDTEEGTNGPLAIAGNGLAVIRIGNFENPSGTRVVALVSLADGRIVRRIEATRRVIVTSIAVSPDAKTIFYTGDGAVYALSVDGGEPRKIGLGDNVVAHPNGKELIVERSNQGAANLYRLPVDGGAEQEIPYKSDLNLRPMLSPTAVRADGKIAITVLRPDSWWDGPAILDPATGAVQKLTVPFDGDVLLPAWTSDGHMIATGFGINAALWRFQRESRP